MTRRKPTADDRDRAIVAGAGPWWVDGACVSANTHTSYAEDKPALAAAARILNRIVREKAKHRKGKR